MFQEAARAYDLAVHLYLGEDAACNFAAVEGETSVLEDAIILEWWGRTGGNGAVGVVEVAEVAEVASQRGAEHGETQETSEYECAPAEVKREAEYGGGPATGEKRTRDEDDGSESEMADGSNRPTHRQRISESGREETEWADAEWAAFRKRLARETAAADATEANLRSTKTRCRSSPD